MAQARQRAKPAAKAPEGPTRREGQEGSRWINVRPTGDEIARWFKDNVAIEQGLKHEDYVSGITLIQQTEKAREVINWSPEGQPVIAERSNLVYVPYAKVETRVKYFHDLMRLKADDWLGVIEPVKQFDPALPPGFFFFTVPTGDNRGVRYICCSMQVVVYKRDTVSEKRYETGSGHRRHEIIERTGETIIDAPPATKMIPVSGQRGADNFSLMKAETGAVGRALGLAGMLVIPGTGVATAEDMAEAEQLDRQPPPQTEPQTPQEDRPAQEVLTELRQRAAQVIGELRDSHPERFEDFKAWAQQRGIGAVNDITDQPKLRGLITKAERELDEAASEPTEEK